MKITITSFGPIASFKYDLSKDIIVTYGDNNIGKSYAMQIVYLLLKNLSVYGDFRDNFFQMRYGPETIKNVRASVDKFVSSGASSQDITSLINTSILSDMYEGFVKSFINSCQNTFGNFKSIIEQKPKITLDFDKFEFEINLEEKSSIYAKIFSQPTYLKRANSDFHKSRNANGRFDIYYYNNVDTPVKIIMENIEDKTAIIARTIKLTVGSVYFLPASRSGIYSGMSAFSSIIAELSKNKAILTRKIELPGISEPISDYFLLLSNIRGRENPSTSAIYGEIENDILKGSVKFNRSRNTLVYIPEGMQYEFEMTEVSSMVSEISPIVAFLKYIVATTPGRLRKFGPNPILFIEEPEAHLHPKNQIKLIELFSELHKSGIKIIISSHSNYIFNKLNNLLLKKEITTENYCAIKLELREGGSESSFMQMDELGVDDTNFLDVSQQLYEERESLIISWNEQV